MDSYVTTDLILNRMKEKPKGTIFTNNDFYDLGSRSAIKTSIFRLAQKKEIHRLIDGYYTIPYFSTVLHEYSYPTANQLAEKIARKHAWNICPFGDTALNQVGLTTQVPVVCEYISDGPYREFKYTNRLIKFKHTNNRSISKFGNSLSLIIQCIKAIGQENITERAIYTMAVFCKRYVEEDIIKDTKTIPAWMYEIIKKINEVNI